MTLLLRPNPSSGVPVYLQLMDQVRRAIETGALRPGETLPAVRPLAENLVVSPKTVARAYQELEEAGIIEMRQGDRSVLGFSRVADPSAATAGWDLQSSLVLENSRLTALIAAEAAERAERGRELDYAKEVQQRLFPQAYPVIEGLDYAGACRPALGIGGDYFDFIRLSESELGIAIGDVSGKGIPAALLMATLRAYLHGQTSARLSSLPAVMVNLNRLVYESSAANRYATFFYAQYDATTRVLEYVNAGHNPPLIFRTVDGRHEILRLDTGGPAIGLIPTCAYAQGRVTLQPGDVLIAFTDGITEAMNADGDEWGEDQLTQTIERSAASPARSIIDQIMRTADRFVGAASQYDDMTLVAVRVG
jgi:sigma-B regulation protein RsbU (phosphoserine phosphatase)